MLKQQVFKVKIFSGVVLGLTLGWTVRLADPSKNVIDLVSFPGELFMRMLKMLLIPFLFTSVVVGENLPH